MKSHVAKKTWCSSVHRTQCHEKELMPGVRYKAEAMESRANKTHGPV